MDALSFSLGIAFVVVIVIAIVAVDAFVKVRLAKLDINNLAREVDDNRGTIYRDMNDRTEELIRMVDSRCNELERGITSQMDSRFDRLIERKQLLKS